MASTLSKEMHDPRDTAPRVYEICVNHGNFSVRRSDGKHNGVVPDMIIEQTYNVNIKQVQGICGITLNKAQT